jgi:myo-inositol 2-dehydrogenase/D-chiro-inositol 1-dehydrogenase
MRLPVRLGIAGCGRIADRGYLPAAEPLAEVELAAVADPDRDRAERLAAALGGASTFASVEDMVAAGELDGVVVATPVDSHVTTAAIAAAAGLPCLVEKPPASGLAGALELEALDPAPAVGFNRRFLQGVDLAPSIPAEGWLELDLELRFRRGGWGAHESRDEALLDAGVHLIDLAAYLTGAAPIAVRRAELGQERASLELELGRARARIACATDRAYAERIEVADRAGRTVAASRTGRLRARLARLRDGEDQLVASLRRQLECFAATIHGEEADGLADADAAVVAMSVVEAARRSAALDGAEVTVRQPVPDSEARP